MNMANFCTVVDLDPLDKSSDDGDLVGPLLDPLLGSQSPKKPHKGRNFVDSDIPQTSSKLLVLTSPSKHLMALTMVGSRSTTVQKISHIRQKVIFLTNLLVLVCF